MNSLIIKIVAFLAIAHVLPGFHVAGFGTAVLMAVVYSFVSWLAAVFVGLSVLAVAMAVIAACPQLAVLALFATPLVFFFLEFLVALVALTLTSGLLPGFDVGGMGTAFVASLLLGIVSAATSPARTPVPAADPRVIEIRPG